MKLKMYDAVIKKSKNLKNIIGFSETRILVEMISVYCTKITRIQHK